MRQFAAGLVAVGVLALSAQGAVVHYVIGGTSDYGTSVSGSFSYDTADIREDYLSSTALDDLLTFTVQFTSIPGDGPETTSFTKGVETSPSFYLATGPTGAITDFGPEFNANSDNYSLFLSGFNTSGLAHPGNVFPADYVTFTFTQVPELSHSAIGVGLGLLAFAGMRAWRQRR